MNIEEVRKAKEKLAKDVAALIDKFATETGVNIIGVAIDMKTHWDRDLQKQTSYVTEVFITLEQI